VLWLNVAVPASGSNLIIDATGTPTEGSPVYGGAINGATTFSPSAKIDLVECDQEDLPIDAILTAEVAEIDVEMMESDLAKLQYYLLHATYTTSTDTRLPAGAQNIEKLTFGGIVPITKRSIAAISMRRDASNKYVIAQLYSAVQMEAIKLPFTRKKETTYKVKFSALAVTTRSVGDKGGQLWRQL
jgi:hypothetical protein